MSGPASTSVRSPRILVLRGGAIGDFILTLPAIQALRERWPDAFIELNGYPHIAGLALEGGLVNHVGSLDAARFAHLFTPRGALEPAFLRHLGSFDIVLSYLSDVDGVVRENLAAAGGRLVLYAPPMPGDGMHATDHYVRPLESLALYAGGTAPTLIWPAERQDAGRRSLERMGLADRTLVIHPGSGSPRKNWPASRFASIADKMRHRGWTPCFLLGEADNEVAAALDRLPGPATIPRIRGDSLLETASLLASCRGFLGNDSGITHLAAALGIQTLALFGPTCARTWGPRGRRVRLVEAPDGHLENLTVDEVELRWLEELEG